MSRNKGILFVAIDHTRPLSEQGPFDIVLHKVNRLYSVPISSDWFHTFVSLLTFCKVDLVCISHSLTQFFPILMQLSGKEWRRVLEVGELNIILCLNFQTKLLHSFVSMRKRLSSFHTYITSSINDIGHAFTDCWAACYHVAWKLIPVRHNLQRNALSPVMSHDLIIEVEASSSVWGSFSFMGTFTWVTGFH